MSAASSASQSLGAKTDATASSLSSLSAKSASARADGAVYDRTALSKELLDVVDRFDRDGDGDIDTNELLLAMQELLNEKRTNRQLVRVLVVGAFLFAMMIASVFAVSIAAAVIVKDTKVKSSSSSPAVMRTAGGDSEAAISTVRTAAINPISGLSPSAGAPAGETPTARAVARAAAHARNLAALRDGEITLDTVFEDPDGPFKVACEGIESHVRRNVHFVSQFEFTRTASVLATMQNAGVPLTLAVPSGTGRGSAFATFTAAAMEYVPADELEGFAENIGVLDLLDESRTKYSRICCEDSGDCIYAVGQPHQSETESAMSEDEELAAANATVTSATVTTRALAAGSSAARCTESLLRASIAKPLSAQITSAMPPMICFSSTFMLDLTRLPDYQPTIRVVNPIEIMYSSRKLISYQSEFVCPNAASGVFFRSSVNYTVLPNANSLFATSQVANASNVEIQKVIRDFAKAVVQCDGAAIIYTRSVLLQPLGFRRASGVMVTVSPFLFRDPFIPVALCRCAAVDVTKGGFIKSPGAPPQRIVPPMPPRPSSPSPPPRTSPPPPRASPPPPVASAGVPTQRSASTNSLTSQPPVIKKTDTSPPKTCNTCNTC